EALIIDDGSTDNSAQIADEFCIRDQRFTVYHKKNGGIASARNFGLEKAQGTYIIHHDADDQFADKRALKKLYDKATETDAGIIMGDYTIVSKKGEHRVKQEFNGKASELI